MKMHCAEEEVVERDATAAETWSGRWCQLRVLTQCVLGDIYAGVLP